MKLQKARSIVHHHKIAKERLDALDNLFEAATHKVNLLDEVPKALRGELNALESKLAVLNEERVRVLEEITTTKGLLSKAPEGMALARATVTAVAGKQKLAAAQLKKHSVGLEEAVALIAEVETRWKEEVEREALVRKAVAKWVEDGRPLEELTDGLSIEDYVRKTMGKPVAKRHMVPYDSMGNESREPDEKRGPQIATHPRP